MLVSGAFVRGIIGATGDVSLLRDCLPLLRSVHSCNRRTRNGMRLLQRKIFNGSLLSVQTAKTSKSVAALNTLTAVMYLAPEQSSGLMNLCPDASEGCIGSCLHDSGRFNMKRKGERWSVGVLAQIARTLAFAICRECFIAQLVREVRAFMRSCSKKRLAAALRLNGTADLPWHILAPVLFALDGLQLYDYTKSVRRMFSFLHGELPAGYHVTFSRSENSTAAQLDMILSLGGNVAVVHGKGVTANTLPELLGVTQWRHVVDGDRHDARYVDGSGVLVRLTAKGRAKKDTSGFVVRGGAR